MDIISGDFNYDLLKRSEHKLLDVHISCPDGKRIKVGLSPSTKKFLYSLQ